MPAVTPVEVPRNSPHWPFFTFALGGVPAAALLSWASVVRATENQSFDLLLAIVAGAIAVGSIAAVGTLRGYDRLWTAFAMVAGVVASVPWAGLLWISWTSLMCWGRDPCF